MEEWKITITFLIAISGWYIGYYFNKRKEELNKRREIRITYLINAYQKLENIVERNESNKSDLEKVVADIQLFGTENQIALIKEMIDNMINKGSADMLPLLEELRKDLRTELKLSKTEQEIKFLRVG